MAKVYNQFFHELCISVFSINFCFKVRSFARSVESLKVLQGGNCNAERTAILLIIVSHKCIIMM